MKIALLGATGNIGKRIAAEALQRGHQITAVLRDPKKLEDPRFMAVQGDVTDPASLVKAVAGHDAVISAVGPAHTGLQTLPAYAARALVQALPKAGVKRLLVVGGAGSLEARPGLQLVDSPDFPAAWKPAALSHRDALKIFRDSGAGLDWTFFSPAALIEPGARTGKYRTGGDQLLVDDNGKSYITAEDFAVAMLDELENPKNLRRRMTVAY
jgi:putative NADH-flavin reductase